MADAVVHQAKRAIAEGQPLAKALIERHFPRAFDLLVEAFVHIRRLYQE
jgi:hypothetical protein